ncbi:MAG TPA: DUF1326 domain-containing protein [Gammaproteobacteria bacterium]|nr:DUF1326 domain-containing protein [Gammaproteobacteria bacterium]
MSDIQWRIKGRDFVHCNCAYGCPCQFNAPPTYGDCQAVAAFDVVEGHHGDVRLDGLRFGMVARWPGAIHEGGGEVVPIVDQRASPEQREAILRIMTGQDTEPGATIFQVFSATFETLHDPVFTRIDLELDVDARTARLNVPDLIEARGEPIVNPVTGETHQARINLPDGFEYDVTEIGRGWAQTRGPIQLSLADSNAQFAYLEMTGNGVVH